MPEDVAVHNLHKVRARGRFRASPLWYRVRTYRRRSGAAGERFAAGTAADSRVMPPLARIAVGLMTTVREIGGIGRNTLRELGCRSGDVPHHPMQNVVEFLLRRGSMSWTIRAKLLVPLGAFIHCRGGDTASVPAAQVNCCGSSEPSTISGLMMRNGGGGVPHAREHPHPVRQAERRQPEGPAVRAKDPHLRSREGLPLRPMKLSCACHFSPSRQ